MKAVRNSAQETLNVPKYFCKEEPTTQYQVIQEIQDGGLASRMLSGRAVWWVSVFNTAHNILTNYQELLESVLNLGAPVISPNHQQGDEPDSLVMVLVSHTTECCDVVKKLILLIKRGVNIGLKDDDGNTAFHIFCGLNTQWKENFPLMCGTGDTSKFRWSLRFL